MKTRRWDGGVEIRFLVSGLTERIISFQTMSNKRRTMHFHIFDQRVTGKASAVKHVFYNSPLLLYVLLLWPVSCLCSEFVCVRTNVCTWLIVFTVLFWNPPLWRLPGIVTLISFSFSGSGLSIVCCTQTRLGVPAPGDFNTLSTDREGGMDSRRRQS